MAHYFKFHSLDEIREEVTRLGLGIIFQEDLSPLFQKLQIGPVTIGNRFCIQPMEGCDTTSDGKPGELTLRRYQRFGSGGAKLIWGEAAAVVPEGRANSRQLIVSESNLTDLRQIVETCRGAHRAAFGSDDDLLLGLQLTHSGRNSWPRPIIACRDPVLDKRTFDKTSNRTVEENYPILTDDELKNLEDTFVKAASIAHRAGFQFVDLKQCHRYLLNELLSARNRPGPYGGSLENRTRLARNIIGRIQQEVPGLLIASRMNVYDGLPFHASAEGPGQVDSHELPLVNYWGTNPERQGELDLTEPISWATQMRQLGVVLLNASMGNPYASPHFLRPFEYPPPDGYSTPEHPLIGVNRHFNAAGLLQRQLGGFPVVGSGYSYLQDFFPQAAAANISQGNISLIGVGRASLSQPDFVKQLMDHGKLDRKRICRTFSYCTALMRSKHNEEGQFPTGCPPFDKEGYGAIWKLAQLGVKGRSSV